MTSMRKILLTSLALAVAATPALADRGADAADGAPKPPKSERPATAKGPKGTHYLLHACVVNNASATGVDLAVLGGNRHMKRVLDGDTTFTAALDTSTVIRLVGKARQQPAGSTPKRLPKIGTHLDLQKGDRVIVRFRTPGVKPRDVKPGADLPAAFKVIDRGPVKACAPADPKVEAPKDAAPAL
jgi:hypothetical protein